jgi:predicted RNA binding protein YcfA (HicA-like mRNA interferase family)
LSDKLPRVCCNELARALERAGFVRRGGGRHVIFENPQTGRHCQVPMHGKVMVKLGTLRYILQQAGLSDDDLKRLL